MILYTIICIKVNNNIIIGTLVQTYSISVTHVLNII